VIFVHGGLMDGSSAWTGQNPLASSFRLRFMDRFGYGRSADRPDDARLEADIAAVVDLAHGGAHLVGHSYGALICLVATARAPADVLSLTLIEPPALSIARDDPNVESLIRRLTVALPAARDQAPPIALRTFFDALGLDGPPPSSASEERAIRSTFREPPPWEVLLPMSSLIAAGRPTLLVSGAWAGGLDNVARHEAGTAFQRICEILAGRLNATHATITGAAHAVQFTGPPFNARLRSFIESATNERS
jgi:pimeloyl-ACP methyl ester carboxylesterase